MNCIRYEVYDHKDKCYGGFLHNVDDLFVPMSTMKNINRYWNKNLPVTPHMEGNFKTYFTPEGIRRFKRGIASLIDTYSNNPFCCDGFECIMRIKEVHLNLDDFDENLILYRDKYQIVVSE